MPLDKLTLEIIRRQVATALADLEPLFRPEMRLTFVARHPDHPDRIMIVTNDDDLAGLAADVRRQTEAA